uniref:ANK_REP_REGION domain-containing protein n=1 Tax=Heterorhabditis bacteriophora TaxID=37862 RepID=A0A1I7WA47_HETBA
MDAIARAVEACQKGSLEGLGQAMCDGVLPNDLDHDGCSLLHWAAINNRVAVVESKSATCNVRDTQGYTPIHLAVQSNQASLVAYLLEKFDYCRDSTDNSGELFLLDL